MTRYVLGFMFSESLNTVLLIEKQRPNWQKGKLNGVGGHIEEGEFALDAMIREFGEETGIHTHQQDWGICATMSGPEWECVVYAGVGPITYAQDLTDEVLYLVNTVSDPNADKLIDNLRYLIPIAKESLQGNLRSIPNFTYGGNSGK